MHESTTFERSVSAPTDFWRDENSRGLTNAAAGNWSDATLAFTSAADELSARSDVAAHDALALILNNLAQSCFHDGRTEDAIRYSQRACSLRVALVGEDAIAVARARAELAVMLGSANRAPEGLALIARAISAIERSGGDEDIRLLTVLENAARLALAAGEPSTAEPYLLRLHALLDANGMTTDGVESLLARVVTFRLEQQVMAMESMAGVSHDPEPAVELPMLVIDAFGDADDEPLRDAVAITDVLLRTTPTGSRAIQVDDAVTDEHALDADIFGGAMFELLDLADTSTTTKDHLHDDVPVENQTVASTNMLVELDLLIDDSVHTPLELVTMQQTHQSPVDLGDGGLGFTVEYGAISTAAPFDGLSDTHIAEVETPVGEVVSSVPAQRTTPIGTLQVLPTPSASQPTTDQSKDGSRQTEHTEVAPRLTALNTDNTATSRQPKKPVLRAGRASAPKSSHGTLIFAAAAAALAAGAGWFFMMAR